MSGSLVAAPPKSPARLDAGREDRGKRAHQPAWRLDSAGALAAGAHPQSQPVEAAQEFAGAQLHDEAQLHAGMQLQGWHLQWVVIGTS